MKPLLFKVTARFILKDTGKPVQGKEYDVWLYDKDPLIDDKLGEGTLDKNGRVEIACDLSDASTMDSPVEKHPDLYFILLKHGKEIFRSPDRCIMPSPHKRSFAAEELARRQQKRPATIAVIVIAAVIVVIAVGYALYLQFIAKGRPHETVAPGCHHLRCRECAESHPCREGTGGDPETIYPE